MKTIAAILPSFVLVAMCAALPMQAADAVVLQIKADQVTAKVSPMLYGYMTEEINYSYDGGLYAELVRNRAFKKENLGPTNASRRFRLPWSTNPPVRGFGVRPLAVVVSDPSDSPLRSSECSGKRSPRPVCRQL
jgi:hypothetical protein